MAGEEKESGSGLSGILKKFQREIIGAIIGGSSLISLSAFTFYYGTKNTLETHSVEIQESKKSIKAVQDKVSSVETKVLRLEETPARIDSRIDNIEKSMDQLRDAQQKQVEQNQKIYEILIQMQREK